MHRLLVIVASVLATIHCSAAELTQAEARWLQASTPVLDFAKQHRIPLDVVVDHHPQPGDAPLSVGFEAGRCQLVYAIRGNPEADAALADADPDLVPVVIEAMAAHELGHCWRYVRRAWHTMPAGFSPPRDADRDRARARLRRDMHLARVEEGYADLVGLAWTQRQHPALYGRLHDWFCRVRGHPPVPGAPHDTGAWIDVARDPASFPPLDSPFEQALALWRRALPTEH